MSTLREKSHLAYSQMADHAKQTESLGWEAKVSVGKFGKRELDAHKEISRLYGRHQAFAEAADDLITLQSSHEEMVKALQEYRLLHSDCAIVPENGYDGRCSECKDADYALANAAKLAPTRTGSSGCEG